MVILFDFKATIDIRAYILKDDIKFYTIKSVI